MSDVEQSLNSACQFGVTIRWRVKSMVITGVVGAALGHRRACSQKKQGKCEVVSAFEHNLFALTFAEKMDWPCASAQRRDDARRVEGEDLERFDLARGHFHAGRSGRHSRHAEAANAARMAASSQATALSGTWPSIT